MKTHHFNPSTMPEEARKIFRMAFPGYTGKKLKMRGTDAIDMRSYWSGGSRDYFVVVRIDGAVLTIPQQSAFDKPVTSAIHFEIPEGMCVVEHTIFQGKDLGLTIHVPIDRMAGMLPATILLTGEQRKLLQITAQYRSGYRREEAARAQIDYNKVKAELVNLGMLRANGSITPEGRNQT